MSKAWKHVTVEIIEQPDPSMRFRYECEGPTAGSIVGINSTEAIKTFPSIRIHNYDGPGCVLVSCVTIDKTPKPHPNSLVGKSCNRGVCTYDFSNDPAPRTISFPNLGVQCPKVADVTRKIEEREKVNVDPFRTGFQHKHKPKIINCHQLRLCFQVFIRPDPENPKHLVPLKPVVSDIISDKHRTNMKLLIHDVSDCSSQPCGGKKIMLFCEKVDRKDITIRFYEEDTAGNVVWEEPAHFQPNNVHKQLAIAFRTPPYKVQHIDRPVNVFLRLKTISDGRMSNAVPFQFVPDPCHIDVASNAKKRKIDDSRALYEFLEAESQQKYNIKSEFEPNVVGPFAANIPSGSTVGAFNANIPPGQNVGGYSGNIPPGSNVGAFTANITPGPNVGAYSANIPPGPNVGAYSGNIPPGPNVGAYSANIPTDNFNIVASNFPPQQPQADGRSQSLNEAKFSNYNITEYPWPSIEQPLHHRQNGSTEQQKYFQNNYQQPPQPQHQMNANYSPAYVQSSNHHSDIGSAYGAVGGCDVNLNFNVNLNLLS